MTDKPLAYLARLCDTCDQPWDKHVAASMARIQRKIDSMIDHGDHQTKDEWMRDQSPEVLRIHASITVGYQDCVEVLKVAQRGSQGVPGPQGQPGPPGPEHKMPYPPDSLGYI